MIRSDQAPGPAPEIAVVMPVFNRAAKVRKAIDSVLGGTFARFEILVVDDCSTDGTVEAARACADARVQVIALDRNSGANRARNEGIRAARAPLLSFLDSDDLFLPARLQSVVEFFGRRPDVDAVIDSCIRRRPGHQDRIRRNPVLDDNDAILGALFDRRLFKATPGISVRRDAAVRAGQFDEGLRRRQDYDFLLRLAKAGRLTSRDEATWIKVGSEDDITGDLGNALGGIFALWDRHPEHFAALRAKSGMVDDLGRHFVKLLARRRFDLIGRDLRAVLDRFGPGALASLPLGALSYARRAIRTGRRTSGRER